MAKKAIRSALVIGGTGFVGAPFVEALTKSALERVSVVHTNALGTVAPSRTHYYHMDANDAYLADLIAVHDAVAILIPPDMKTMRSICAAIRAARPRHVLYTSTSLLYKGGARPQKENAPLESVTVYERAKRMEEKILMEACKKSGSQLTIARLGSVYGNVHNAGVVGRAFHAIFRNEEFSVRPGNRVRDYIHVDDVAQALAYLLVNPPKKSVDIINVSSGVGVALDDVLAQIEKAAGAALKKVVGAPSKESESIIADSGYLARRMNFEARELKRGLRQTHAEFLAWYDDKNAV